MSQVFCCWWDMYDCELQDRHEPGVLLLVGSHDMHGEKEHLLCGGPLAQFLPGHCAHGFQHQLLSVSCPTYLAA